MVQIYYDPTGGFLYSLDGHGNAEVVKTDPCVFLPENVFVDKQGYIHVKNLQGKDQILTDEKGVNISIKGPSGRDARIIHSYEADQPVYYTKIIEKLNPGTYTIYGMVTAPSGTDPFTSACIVVGKMSLPNNGTGQVYTFGESFTVNNAEDVYIVFADPAYIKEIFNLPAMDWTMVEDSPRDLDIIVENIHVCVHGLQGFQGLRGEKGEQGPQGPQGERGIQGLQGLEGQQGPAGPLGAPGKNGTSIKLIDDLINMPQSPQIGDICILTKNSYDLYQGNIRKGSLYEYTGNVWTLRDNITGPKGDVGEKGDMGEKGADGLTFTPSISEDGVLSWTNSGNVSNPQPISIKGPKGDQGETGAQGPQGEKGEKGETGPQGIQGEQGPQGEKGADGQTPVFEISDGSLKYKIGEQDWTNLITDKSIFTQPDVQTVLPENPTHGQIILWEGNPSMGIDVRFTPGCKYKYLAAGYVMKNTRLIGKAPNSESYTVFKLSDSSLVPAFNLDSIKKEILTSTSKVVTLQGVYSKMTLEEGQTSLTTLLSIYEDGKKGFTAKITDSVKVMELIDANPTETHWAVVELEEVLESGTWIQIS